MIKCIVFLFIAISTLSLNAFAAIPAAAPTNSAKSSGYQDKVSFSCLREGRALNFEISRATHIVVFTSLAAMDYPQMPFNLPVAIIDNGSSFDVSYDWYYTAEYNFKLSEALSGLNPGNKIQLWLNGDDHDGSTYNNEEYSCEIH